MSAVANLGVTFRTGGDAHPADAPVAAVVRETVAAVVEHFEAQLQGIILTGSAARGEATILPAPGGWEFLGDCEFVLVFARGKTLPPAGQVAEIQREIERRLRESCIACPLGLSPVHPAYLERLGPQIYSFELKQCGWVVWGDPHICRLIPDWAASDILREDGWRLVSNRMIEQLFAACTRLRPATELPLPFDYRTVKLALDLATSFLLFCGEYAPSYRERSARLVQVAATASPECGYPFPLLPFAELVRRLTHWKICPSSSEAAAIARFQPMVWDYTRRLWTWQLLQLSGTSEAANPIAMRRWMRQQPLAQRLQGWASLTRRCGWRKSLRLWPHWTQLGWQASPRYWIYATAGELFFELPRLIREGDRADSPDVLASLRKRLPVPPRTKKVPTSSWQQLASDIHWNYRKFLTGTVA